MPILNVVEQKTPVVADPEKPDSQFEPIATELPAPLSDGEKNAAGSAVVEPQTPFQAPFTPNIKDPTEDGSAEFEKQTKLLAAKAFEEEIEARVAAREAAKDAAREAVKDIGRGLFEVPTQTASGISEAFQNTVKLWDDMAFDLAQKFPSLGTGITVSESGELAISEKAAETGVAPVTDPLFEALQKEPETVTGSMVRGGAKFLTGFLVAGKAMKSLSLMTKAGPFTQATVKGMVSDFTVMDAEEKRLSDLIEAFPQLSNPVSQFLASNPDDARMEARTKNALEGAGMGVVAEGMIHALKALRSSRIARSLFKNADSKKEVEGITTAVRKYDFDDMGDPTSDKLIRTRKAKDAVKLSEDVDPSKLADPAENVFDINWARIENADDVKNVITNMAKLDETGTQAARRGVRTWKQTKLSAKQEDAWSSLMNRRKGEPMNAEQTLAARELWVSSAQKLKDLAKQASQNPSEANLYKFRRMAATHFAIQREVIAARTETARALNAWKIPAGSDEAIARQIEASIDNAGGTKNIEKMADHIAKLSDLGMDEQLEKYIEKSVFAKTRAAIQQVWINGMLTSLPTHGANVASNASVMGIQILERRVAPLMTRALGVDGVVETAEAAAMVGAARSAFRDAMRASAKVAMGEESSFARLASRKVEDGHHALSAEAWGIVEDSTLGKSMNLIDTATRTPGRFLQAGDEFFKTIGYRMELAAQATRQVSQEFAGQSVEPDVISRRMAEIMADPPEHIHLEAVDAALYSTFTNKPAETLSKVASAIQNIPVAGKLIIPFKNAPINITTFAFERTPLAPLVGQWRADIAAGGAKRELALAKMATSTTLMTAAADLAWSGLMTGAGPQEPRERQAWLRQGNRPYSVKVGDEWYSYNRLDPVGMTLGMAADFAEISANAQGNIDDEELEKILVASGFSMLNNITQKTYMKSMGEFFDAVSDPKYAGERWLQRVASGAVPAFSGGVTRSFTDPNMRVAETMLDKVKSRVPGLSESLPLYRDLWGRPVSYRSGKGALFDFLTPVYISKEDPQPIDEEFFRLEYFPSMPERSMDMGGIALELDHSQYERFVELAGKDVRDEVDGLNALETLNAIVEGRHTLSDAYLAGTDGEYGTRRAILQRVIENFRKQAKVKMLEEFPELRDELDFKRWEKEQGL